MDFVARALRKLHNVFDRGQIGFAVFGVAGMLILTFVAVLTRYVFKIPAPWVEEFARLLLIATAFIAAAAVTQRREHIRVDILQYVIHSEKARLFIHLVLTFILLAAFSAFTYASYGYMMRSWSLPMHLSSVPVIHMGFIKSFPFIGTMLVSIWLAVILAKDSIELAKKYR